MFTRLFGFLAWVSLVLFMSPSAMAMPSYFSYYALGRDIAVTVDHVNLYWVYTWNWEQQDAIDQLVQAKALGLPAMLHTEFVFFEGPNHAPDKSLFSLRSDAEARWNVFINALQQRDLLSTVLAVYPCDEPDLNGVNDDELQQVIKIIRAHPLSAGINIATFFTANIAKEKGGPYALQNKEHNYETSLRMFDWVGFDCYGCSNIFTEASWQTIRLDNGIPRLVDGPALYENFRNQLDLPRQRIMLIPQAFLSTDADADGNIDQPDDPQLFFDKAQSDPAVIALIPFAWFDYTGWIGTSNLPALQDKYRKIGQTIIASAYAASTASGTAVEYVNTLDFPLAPGGHYFYTDDPLEQQAVDAGMVGRFVRTGYNFKTGGTKQLCRFYGSIYPGPNSHFFTINDEECRQLQNLQSSPIPSNRQQWNFEGFGFRETPPLYGKDSTVSCPLGWIPVYRYYNDGSRRGIDSNHRFGTDKYSLDAFASASGWVAEGVAFCAAP